MRTVKVRLDSDLADWLKRAAAKSGVSQGKLIRDQLEKVRAGTRAQGSLRLAGSAHGSKDLSSRMGFWRP